MSHDLSTRIVHHAYRPPAGFEAPQVGVHKASIVIFPDTAALRARDWRRRDGYTYGLHGTPTTFTLEERIATLEGGLQTVLLPSGLGCPGCGWRGIIWIRTIRPPSNRRCARAWPAPTRSWPSSAARAERRRRPISRPPMPDGAGSD